MASFLKISLVQQYSPINYNKTWMKMVSQIPPRSLSLMDPEIKVEDCLGKLVSFLELWLPWWQEVATITRLESRTQKSIKLVQESLI